VVLSRVVIEHHHLAAVTVIDGMNCWTRLRRNRIDGGRAVQATPSGELDRTFGFLVVLLRPDDGRARSGRSPSGKAFVRKEVGVAPGRTAEVATSTVFSKEEPPSSDRATRRPGAIGPFRNRTAARRQMAEGLRSPRPERRPRSPGSTAGPRKPWRTAKAHPQLVEREKRIWLLFAPEKMA
jgi:hypothetical protein